ncbi:DUF4097 family beta strand repeat-containing protein [Ferrimonas gelatinilytica]|uniref:DUF4097 family beta strand repeat-containing protein n=1 Tax=Ferrimonas gelatinilytica TaxID=1255257 RepID=A0ABP9S8S7_9GAMM
MLFQATYAALTRAAGAIILPLILLFSLPLSAKEVDQTLTWDGSLPVEIELPRGQLKLTGNDSNTLHLQGRVDEEASEFLFEVQNQRILLKVVLPEQWHQDRNQKGASDLQLSLPRSIALSMESVSTDLVADNLTLLMVQTVSGDIELSNSEGQIRLNSISGDITLNGIKENLRAESVSGDIRLSQGEGELTLQSVSGDIEVRSSEGAVKVESVSGDVEVQASRLTALSGRSVSGDLEVQWQQTQANTILNLETVSGDMTLRSQTPITIEAQSGPGGEIRNRWSDAKPLISKYSRSESLSLSGSGATARLNTVSGTITLAK